MYVLIDVIALALCVSVAYAMFRRGFFLSLVDLVLYLAALYGAKFLCPILQAPVAKILRECIAINTIPAVIADTLSLFGDSLSMVLAYLLILIVLLGILIVLFMPLAKVVNVVLKLPLLKQLNKILGAFLGLAAGGLLVYFLLIVLLPTLQAAYFADIAPIRAEDSVLLTYIKQASEALLDKINVYIAK